MGGYYDNANAGAAWVYTRSGGVWSQQGTKLVGAGAVGAASQGYSVAVSGDGNTAVVGGLDDNSFEGAAWVFIDPSPQIAAIADVPNDQGGKVSIRWGASLLDHAPFNPINEYWIWRQVPIHTALQALASGATLMGQGAAAGTPFGRTLRTSIEAGQVYYWEYVGSQVSHGFPGYSYTAPTTADSVPGSNPYTLFMVEAENLSTGEYWSSGPDSGYSVDNLPPLAAAEFTGQYAAGATTMQWGANREPDLAYYRLYRGAGASFVTGPATLVVEQSSTAFVDAPGRAYDYKLTAVDVHGNESTPTLLLSNGTVDVHGASTVDALALAAPTPSPSRTGSMFRFSPSREGRVTLALYDSQGRRVRTLAAGVLGEGEHVMRWDGRDDSGRALASGIYFLRLEAAGQTLVRRLANVE